MYLLKLISIAASALVLTGVDAHKILMTGSLEKSENLYFQKVSTYLSVTKENSYPNTVYLLTHDQKSGADFEIKKINERFYTIQVPKLMLEGELSKVVEHARLGRFFYNPTLKEEENFINLDVEHT